MVFENIFNPQYWAVVPFHFWSLVFFSFGCIVGSFLNVCIYRMPREGMSVISPPSHCPHCKYSIPFYLNVPLLTWLMLRGKCKNCGAPIKCQYFAVELLTGVTFLVCWLAFGHASPAVALIYCLFLAGLITATFIDFEHFIIPDEITIGGAVVGFILSFFVPQLHNTHHLGESIKASLIGIAVGWGIVRLVLELGKLLFGKYLLELDPESRVKFTEEAILLPPKRLILDQLYQRTTGWFAFQAARVELSDRCYTEIAVAVSRTKVILKTPTREELFNRADLLQFEVIYKHQMSPLETSKLVGVKLSNFRLLIDWVYSLLESLSRKAKTKILPGAHLIFTPEEAWFCPDDMMFESGDVFGRETDAINFHARLVETQFGLWRDVPVRLTPLKLKIGDAEFNPEAVSQMEVVTDRMTMPREAMGLGDVKFMAGIGAFLGWQGAVFSLMASSIIGSIVGIALILLRKHAWSSRMPYGPYIALAAVIWIFGGKKFFIALFQ